MWLNVHETTFLDFINHKETRLQFSAMSFMSCTTEINQNYSTLIMLSVSKLNEFLEKPCRTLRPCKECAFIDTVQQLPALHYPMYLRFITRWFVYSPSFEICLRHETIKTDYTNSGNRWIHVTINETRCLIEPGTLTSLLCTSWFHERYPA